MNGRGASARGIVSVQRVLAELLTDERARAQWTDDPVGFAARHIATAEERDVVASLDPTGLGLAAATMAKKRQLRQERQAAARARPEPRGGS